ncbi:hypothetical protein JCM11491_002948 [Sporobolomyces phaffii]
MESLISETRLAEELAAFKATAGLLATQKIRYSSTYVPPVQDRHRKATLVNVPVCEPPATSSDDADDAAPSHDTVQLTIKSLKPPLTFSIAAAPTATILSLKQQLAEAHASKGAPPAEGQRWILKGKSMGDSKLLKEFSVADGAVINLMLTKTAPAPPAAKSTSDDPEEATATAVPALTLSEPSTGSSSSAASTATTKPAVSLDNLPPASPSSVHSSSAYRERIQRPELWQDIRSALEKRFEGIENRDAECQQAWEAMLGGCQEWIDPGKKALIREQVGYSAMGGY